MWEHHTAVLFLKLLSSTSPSLNNPVPSSYHWHKSSCHSLALLALSCSGISGICHPAFLLPQLLNSHASPPRLQSPHNVVFYPLCPLPELALHICFKHASPGEASISVLLSSWTHAACVDVYLGPTVMSASCQGSELLGDGSDFSVSPGLRVMPGTLLGGALYIFRGRTKVSFLRYFPGALITVDLDLFWISIFFVASAIPSALDYGQLCVAGAGLLGQIWTLSFLQRLCPKNNSILMMVCALFSAFL